VPANRWTPLLRGPAIVALFVGLFAMMVAAAFTAEAWQDWSLDRDGVAVAATVVDVRGDDLTATVRYPMPGRDELVTSEVDVHDEEWHLAPGQAVGLLVDRDHPTRAKLAGDHYPLIPMVALTAFVPLAFPVALLALRWRHARRAERLAEADVPTFRANGRLVPRQRRWRATVTDLHLFPLDDPAGTGPALAVVPLIERYPESWGPSGLRAIDVKGQVRSLGLVVANDDGRVLWPASPALGPSRRMARPAPAGGAALPTT
jgi:hypothetical protein